MKTKEIIIKEQAQSIIDKIEELSITDGEQMTQATSTLSQLNKMLDALVEDREKMTKPLNAALKEIRGKYKPAEEILDNAISALKGKMSKYQTEQLAIQKAESDKIAEKVIKGSIKVETGIRKLGELDSPEERIDTEEGKVSFRTVKKFEVVDMSLLPIQYHLPNEPTIRGSMMAGLELPGVRYWEEQSIINRRN